MIHILLNKPNFDQDWAYPSLNEIITADKKVCILSLMGDEGWSSDQDNWEHRYDSGSRHYEKLVQPFRNYLIPDGNIVWANGYGDASETAAKIKDADILFLTGSDPEQMMENVQDTGLLETLKNYTGIVMGDAAGSQLIMEDFETEYDEVPVKGIGYLKGFALESAYIEDVRHLQRMIHTIEDRGRTVFAYPEQGGVIIRDNHYELLGNAFICSDNDLDKIYKAYHDAQSRQAYYGENENW